MIYFCLESNGFTSPNSDKIHYAYKPVCGDAEIIAHIASISNGGFGGIMFRESLNSGAKKVALRSNLGYYVQRDTRLATNGYHQSQQIFRPGHTWLKITRTGNQFLGYTSANGSNWQFAFFVNINMSDCVYIGLFAEGPMDNVITEACFDNVYSIGGSPSMTNGSENNITGQIKATDAIENGRIQVLTTLTNPLEEENIIQSGPIDPTKKL